MADARGDGDEMTGVQFDWAVVEVDINVPSRTRKVSSESGCRCQKNGSVITLMCTFWPFTLVRTRFM
jgi:hypothetical protein